MCVPVRFYSLLPLIFTFLAASISHFLILKFPCFSSNETGHLRFSSLSLQLFLCYSIQKLKCSGRKDSALLFNSSFFCLKCKFSYPWCSGARTSRARELRYKHAKRVRACSRTQGHGWFSRYVFSDSLLREYAANKISYPRAFVFSFDFALTLKNLPIAYTSQEQENLKTLYFIRQRVHVPAQLIRGKALAQSILIR